MTKPVAAPKSSKSKMKISTRRVTKTNAPASTSTATEPVARKGSDYENKIQAVPTTMTKPVSGGGDRYDRIPISVGLYSLNQEVLGRGSFARVVEAKHRLLDIKVAVKIININLIKRSFADKQLYFRETKLLSRLDHPNIIRLFEFMDCYPMFYIVVELASGGRLSTLVESKGGLEESTAKYYTMQIATGLKYIHSLNIVHRDIKMDNIVFKDVDKKLIKIIDFGLSNSYDKNNLLTSQCGSPDYAAPELFQDNAVGYGCEVDVWSLGIVMYAMILTNVPFRIPEEKKKLNLCKYKLRTWLYQEIEKGLLDCHRQSMAHLSENYSNLVGRLLTNDPQKRIRSEDVLRHPLFLDVNYDPEITKKSDSRVKERARKIVHYYGQWKLHLNRNQVAEHLRCKKYRMIGGMYNLLCNEIQEKGPKFKNHIFLSEIDIETKDNSSKENMRRLITPAYSEAISTNSLKTKSNVLQPNLNHNNEQSQKIEPESLKTQTSVNELKHEQPSNAVKSEDDGWCVVPERNKKKKQRNAARNVESKENTFRPPNKKLAEKICGPIRNGGFRRN